MPLKNSHITVGRVEFLRYWHYPAPLWAIRITERDHTRGGWDTRPIG